MTITEKHVFRNASLVVNGVDLSTYVESVAITLNIQKQPAAGMQEEQNYSMDGVKEIDDIQVTFFQDYAAAKVYATLIAAYNARTKFNVVAKADSGATAATNPAWTIECFVGKMPLMQGTRGDRHMAPVTLVPSAELSIATA